MVNEVVTPILIDLVYNGREDLITKENLHILVKILDQIIDEQCEFLKIC